MRDISELVHDTDKLGETILGFAQKYRSLLAPLPAVLADTVLELHPIVSLSDKVLPLKSYFNFLQDLQRTNFLARTLAREMVSAPDYVAEKGQTFTDIEAQLRVRGTAFLVSSLAALHRKKEGTDNQADKRHEQRIAQDAQQALCTEDVFMLACAFIDVEIAKQGSVYYLKGESPDFRETKKNRNPLNLQDEHVLKSLASGLARPDSERGKVERGQIDSGFNHVVKLNTLKNTMLAAIVWIKEGEREQKIRRKIDVRKKFGLSHTDYERMMSMGRRSGLITFRNRKKDPLNKYSLNVENHQRIVLDANKMGFTPQRTLNNILSDFFKMVDNAHRKTRHIGSSALVEKVLNKAKK